jgi:prepilin-type N-terminal cleavage/methylation domain-containing protein
MMTRYRVFFCRDRNGFTMLRLLVTMAIVAVLLATAFPSIASVTRI